MKPGLGVSLKRARLSIYSLGCMGGVLRGGKVPLIFTLCESILQALNMPVVVIRIKKMKQILHWKTQR